MAKYFDVYTRIPNVKPFPQMWVTAESKMDIINQLLRKRDFIEIHNIVATNVMELSCTNAILCKQEYFMCMVESQYEGEHMNKEKRTTKQVAKTALNAAVVISFFSLVAAAIWLVWDKREVVFNTFYTALAVFAAVLVCKEVWIITKELR